MGNCCTSKDKHEGAYAEKSGMKVTVKDKRLMSRTETSDFPNLNEITESLEDQIDRGGSLKVSLDSFNILKVIGKGAYGKVFLVEDKQTKNTYAMKVLKKSAILDERGKGRVKTERDIIMKIRHPFIVSLHYSFQTDAKLYFILDFLNGGDLYTHITNYGKFNENRARFYNQ